MVVLLFTLQQACHGQEIEEARPYKFLTPPHLYSTYWTMMDYRPYTWRRLRKRPVPIFFSIVPIAKFVRKCPSIAGLRDAKGRTFLHVAVEKKNLRVVRYACRDRSLAWILNMQDNQGNTALHLAVKDESLDIFRLLFGNRQVNLNLTNEDGQTPLDIARYNVRPSFYDVTVRPCSVHENFWVVIL